MLNTRILWLVAACIVLLPACSRRETPDPPTMQAPDLAAQGSHNLAFAVADFRHHADGTQRLLARGRYQGAMVEVRIVLEGDWREQEMGDGRRGYKGLLQLESAGATSDALMRAIDGIYGTKLGKTQLSKSTPFTALSLEGTPQALNAGPVKLKLLYEGGDGRDYCEAFLDIDLSKARIELRQQDPDHRVKLVRVLSESR